MANTLTNLIPSFYKALDVVSRELVGFIPAVTLDPSADMCPLGATMRSPVVPVNSAGGDVTPAMALPAAADQTIGNQPFQISKSRFYPFSWSGEEQKGVDMGPGYLNLREQQIAQAIRALTNEVEADVAVAAYLGGSRAYGTGGTTPFGTANDLSDFAQTRKILDDNGAPASDRALVVNTTAGATARSKQSSLFKVNESGDSSFLRQGILGNVFGLDTRESAKVPTVTAGTGADYLINNAGGYAIGATALTLDGGTGTILAGDVITIGGIKYVVASALAANVVTIAAPGLVAAVADNAPVTVNATSARNVAFSRNAILLGTRTPFVPEEGDMATDREYITDPRSGLVYVLECYPGFKMVTYHVSLAWGVKVLKPEHVAVLLG